MKIRKKIPTLDDVHKIEKHYKEHKAKIEYYKNNRGKIEHLLEVNRKLLSGEEISNEDIKKLEEDFNG
ncbi:MAG: hypothetical protein ACRC92_26900 [Peptostreptococcaceae bacterium]